LVEKSNKWHLENFMNNLIQIAGIIDEEEARLLIDCGVEYLGFPLRLPVHKEDLSEENARKIISAFPENVRGVLITYLDKADEIIEFVNFLNVGFIQLHGEIELSEIKKVKTVLPDLKISMEDKLLHAMAYFLFGMLLIRAFHYGGAKPLSKKLIVTVVLLGFIYGLSDEIHQYFVPGRSSEVLDWLADAIGIMFGVLFYSRFSRFEMQLTRIVTRNSN
jgi:VanZ family protein